MNTDKLQHEAEVIKQLTDALKAVDGYERRHEPIIGTLILNEVRRAIKAGGEWQSRQLNTATEIERQNELIFNEADKMYDPETEWQENLAFRNGGTFGRTLISSKQRELKPWEEVELSQEAVKQKAKELYLANYKYYALVNADESFRDGIELGVWAMNNHIKPTLTDTEIEQMAEKEYPKNQWSDYQRAVYIKGFKAALKLQQL